MKIRNLLAATFCFTASVSCGQKFQTVGNEEFARLISETDSLQLVDVRTPEEFGEIRIPSSININFRDSSFMTKTAEILDPGRPVAVYCRSGVRSADAARQLAGAGYTVTNLEGGITAWREEGRIVTRTRLYKEEEFANLVTKIDKMLK